MQLVEVCGIRRIGFQCTAGRYHSVAALVLMRDILRACQGLELRPNDRLQVLLVALTALFSLHQACQRQRCCIIL